MFYNKKIFKRTFFHPARYWYLNIREIPRYFRDMRYLIKNGYDKCAVWSTDTWFLDTMADILTELRKSHVGYPGIITSEEWEEILGKMVSLLKDMDLDNPKYDDMGYKEQEPLILAAKEEFMSLFSEWFYHLWD